MSDIFNQYMDQYFTRIEGKKGVRNLELLIKTLGYGEGFIPQGRGYVLEEFFEDNPGAIHAVIDFIDELIERNSEWKNRLSEKLNSSDEE